MHWSFSIENSHKKEGRSLVCYLALPKKVNFLAYQTFSNICRNFCAMLLPHTILNVQFLSINSILCQFQNSLDFWTFKIEFKKFNSCVQVLCRKLNFWTKNGGLEQCVVPKNFLNVFTLKIG